VKSEAQTKYYQMGYGSGKRDAEIDRKARDAQRLKKLKKRIADCSKVSDDMPSDWELGYHAGLNWVLLLLVE